jgi:hypothetical protein
MDLEFQAMSTRALKSPRIAIALLSPWGLLPAEQSHFLASSLLDLDLLLLRRERAFHVSAFEPVDGIGRWRLRAEAAALPTLFRDGAAPASSHAERYATQILFAPNAAVTIGWGGEGWRWRHAYADTGHWAVDWKGSRQVFPLAAYVRGVWKSAHWNAMAGITDGERGGYAAAFRLRGQRNPGDWGLEFGHARVRIAEDFVFSGRDSGSAWRNVKAGYRVQSRNIEGYGFRSFGFGTLEGKAAYAWSVPDPHPGAEYQLFDSSQSAVLGAGWKSPAKAWGVAWEYGESQSFSLGKRLPPGGAGFKRFHHALGRAYRNHLGAKRHGGDSAARFWSIEAAYDGYLYRNDPHPEAYSERKETLSYNRLESSFLASVYGGFQNSFELAAARLALHRLAFIPKLGWNQSGWGLEAALPVAWMDLQVRFRDETITRSLFSSVVERTVAWDMRGPIAMAAPTLGARLGFGSWELAIRAAKAVPVWERLRISPQGGQGATGGEGAEYPFLENGLVLQAESRLDF